MISGEFFSGIALATFGASAIFFFRFWRASRDSFFLYFSFSCLLLALERAVLSWVHADQFTVRSAMTEANAWVYLIRLLAFGILILAILQKNSAKKY